MDSQNKSMGTQFPDTIPASIEKHKKIVSLYCARDIHILEANGDNNYPTPHPFKNHFEPSKTGKMHGSPFLLL
jgi:hypothetical protein